MAVKGLPAPVEVGTKLAGIERGAPRLQAAAARGLYTASVRRERRDRAAGAVRAKQVRAGVGARWRRVEGEPGVGKSCC